MKKWKKGVVLITDREGLPGQIQCAECCGIISPGRKFYIANYGTIFFHFNCVQTPENRAIPDPEIAVIKGDLANILSQKGFAEEEAAQAENELLELERKESALRETIGILAEGGR